MRTKILALIAVVGLGIPALGETGQAKEAIQPTLRVNLINVSNWGGQWIFHRSAEGELVLLGQAGPEANAVASSDEGRTWHDWPAVHTWPKGDVRALARQGKELLLQLRVTSGEGPWRSRTHQDGTCDPRRKDRHGVAASFCLAGQSLLIRDFFGLPLPAVGSW